MPSWHIITLFQYNSCYCLSLKEYIINKVQKMFQYNSCYCLSISVLWERKTKHVSIQLLLLFIDKVKELYGDISEFQYNSCYCLSVFISDKESRKILVSIQLLLLFILTYAVANCTAIWFQYNSCYCLSIFTRSNPVCEQRCFNTTLVTVYPNTVFLDNSTPVCFNTTLVTVYLYM